MCALIVFFKISFSFISKFVFLWKMKWWLHLKYEAIILESSFALLYICILFCKTEVQLFIHVIFLICKFTCSCAKICKCKRSGDNLTEIINFKEKWIIEKTYNL